MIQFNRDTAALPQRFRRKNIIRQ